MVLRSAVDRKDAPTDEKRRRRAHLPPKDRKSSRPPRKPRPLETAQTQLTTVNKALLPHHLNKAHVLTPPTARAIPETEREKPIK